MISIVDQEDVHVTGIAIEELHDRWNDSSTPSTTSTVPALFASAVQANPEATALVDGDRRFTYRELGAVVALVDASDREQWKIPTLTVDLDNWGYANASTEPPNLPTDNGIQLQVLGAANGVTLCELWEEQLHYLNSRRSG